jgi:hypothetical protein
MLSITDTTYSKYSRFTFDGNSTASIIVDFDAASGNLGTGTEFSDIIFKNAGTAFRCGQTAGCAEISMIRDQFLNLTSCGVTMRNFNALDMWIWYSIFTNNGHAVSNTCPTVGAGNFNVYKSVFHGSTSADLSQGNTQFFGYRWNYSSGSYTFVSSGGTAGQDNVVIQGNTVLNTRYQHPIVQQDAGPVILLDNTISASGITTGPAVKVGTGNLGELFSMGNTFTASSPVTANGRLHSVNDSVVGSAAAAAPILPSTPPNNGRTIYEISATGSGSTGCTSKAPCALNDRTLTSAARAGSKTVVHLRAGTYRVSATLNVPASDIQIVGDDNTTLNASRLAGAPVLKLAGPTKVVLRDFSISGASNTADGIEIDGADQNGARIFIDQPVISRSSVTGIFVDRLDYTIVEVHNHQLVNNTTTGAIAIDVIGGALAAAGNWQGAQVNLFMGQEAGSYVLYNVASGGHLVAMDCFCGNEQENLLATAGGHKIATISGNGGVAISGGIYAKITKAADPAIDIRNLTGTSSITGAHVYGDTSIAGIGTGGKNAGIGMITGYKVGEFTSTHTPTEPAGENTTLHFSKTPSIGSRQWISGFSNPTSLPSSLSSPNIVLDSTGTTVTMSQGTVKGGVLRNDYVTFYAPSAYSDSSASNIAFLNSLTDYNNGGDQNPQALAEQGSPDATFLANALSLLRNTQPVVPHPLPNGVTDVRIYRVGIDSAASAIHIKH